MTHHILIAMFGAGEAFTHLHVDFITSERERTEEKNSLDLDGLY